MVNGVDGFWDSRLNESLCSFFGVSSVEEIELLPHAAKKTDVMGDATPVQITWLYRVKQIAQQTFVTKYSHSAVDDVVKDLKPLLNSVEAARKVPRILAESGIRFAIVESLPSSRIDGVCFWLDENSPSSECLFASTALITSGLFFDMNSSMSLQAWQIRGDVGCRSSGRTGWHRRLFPTRSGSRMMPLPSLRTAIAIQAFRSGKITVFRGARYSWIRCNLQNSSRPCGWTATA